MNIKQYISDLDISNGDTKRTNCPVCGGVKTFTATNNMGQLMWNCYKAGCSVSGGSRVHLTTDDIRNSLGSTAQETEAVPFQKPEWIIRDMDSITEFCVDWSIDPIKLGLLYDVREHRVVFPVVHNNIMVDATGRALGKKLPKWKRYGKNPLPYVHGCGTTAVVVEDCVSAAIVGATGSSGCSESGVYVGVAVLGTSLSEVHKRYLSQFDTIIVALDPDALPKTLQFAKELRGYANKVKVLRLTDDLKYRNPTDIENLNTLGET